MATKKIFEIGKVAHRADEKNRAEECERGLNWMTSYIHTKLSLHSPQTVSSYLENRTKNSCIIQINFFILLLSEIIVAAYWFCGESNFSSHRGWKYFFLKEDWHLFYSFCIFSEAISQWFLHSLKFLYNFYWVRFVFLKYQEDAVKLIENVENK